MEIDYSIQYEKWHDETDGHYEEMADFYARLLAPILPTLNERARILDVGCGTGLLVNALLVAGYKDVEGIDLSPQQVQRAARRGLPCSVIDVGTLSSRAAEEPASLDAIFLMDVLEHIPVAHQIAFLRDLCLLLKPGGSLVISVPNASSSFAARWRWNDWQHYCAFTEHSLEFVLRNAGLSAPMLFPYEFGLRRKFPFVHQSGFWTGLLRAGFRAIRRLEAIGEFGREGLTIPLGLNILAVSRKPQ